MPGKTDDNPKSATRYQMVTESANKPSLSMAAKVKNLQNNSKFHQSVSMSFHGANFSSANFYTCTTLCHTKREKTKPKTNEKRNT